MLQAGPCTRPPNTTRLHGCPCAGGVWYKGTVVEVRRAQPPKEAPLDDKERWVLLLLAYASRAECLASTAEWHGGMCSRLHSLLVPS